MSEKSEYNRGAKSAKKYFGKFRSFKKRYDGIIIGYKKTGSTEVIGKPTPQGRRGFYGGWAKAEKTIIKSKPVRKINNKPKNNLLNFALGKGKLF